MKKLGILLLSLLAMWAFLATLGCDGERGPQGPKGEPGEEGPDAVIPAPDDRVMAIAIFNGTQKDHNGAHIVSLTFDSTAIPSGSVLVANYTSRPPVIDGIDEGPDVWGPKYSDLDLETQALADNYIYKVMVRAAYDDKNVYFLAKWTEVNRDEFVVGKNMEHLGWAYDDDTLKIMQVYEDRLALMFSAMESSASFWESQGCRDGCHLGDGEPDYMRTSSPSIIFDTWQWGSVRSNALGIALDRALSSAQFENDAGISPIFRNLFVRQRIEGDSTVFDSVPIYMHRYHVDNPDYISDDPMWIYYATPFDEDDLTSNSVVPGWIVQPPSERNDLIKCKGIFSDGDTWTVEFSRPRITNDRFDADF